MSAPVQVETPGVIEFFDGYGPAPVIGPCPHTDCKHWHRSTIAWGPDRRRYELIECDTIVDGCGCRSWSDVTDVPAAATPSPTNGERMGPWLQVGEQTPLTGAARKIPVSADPTIESAT